MNSHRIAALGRLHLNTLLPSSLVRCISTTFTVFHSIAPPKLIEFSVQCTKTFTHFDKNPVILM